MKLPNFSKMDPGQKRTIMIVALAALLANAIFGGELGRAIGNLISIGIAVGIGFAVLKTTNNVLYATIAIAIIGFVGLETGGAAKIAERGMLVGGTLQCWSWIILIGIAAYCWYKAAKKNSE